MDRNLLDEFIKESQDEFFQDLGLEFLEEAERDELFDTISSAVLDNLSARIFSDLPEDKKQEFKNILSQGQEAPKYEFFKQNLPDFDVVFLEETKKVVKRLGGMLKND